MDMLDRFLEQAKISIESGYYDFDLVSAEMNNKTSLGKLLTEEEFCLIAEIKHASPTGEYSFGTINAKEAALEFKNSGADAISVVVEPGIFKGKLSNITEAKAAGLPVLFKDFVIDKRQIRTAAALGADAVLLIVKATNRLGLDLDGLIDYAHFHGVEVLLETYDENEIREALKTNADIIGINNRNLQTLTIDLRRTMRLLKKLGNETNRPIISESGIKSRKDAEKVKNAGAKGILVGTAIWTAKDKAEKIKELKGLR